MRMLHFLVISIIKLGVMHLSYNKRAVLDGRFRHHPLGAVFVQDVCVLGGQEPTQLL